MVWNVHIHIGMKKNSYDNMIITHINSRDGNIPEECPLRKENLEITFELNLNK